VPKGKMTDEHKKALARGRAQGKAVRDYLAALERDRARGRVPDRETLQQRIEDVQRRIDEEENPAKRVELIDAVYEYSERKGIGYQAWREAGVPADVLKRGGIKRTRRTSSES
jgi:hypothetical protein